MPVKSGIACIVSDSWDTVFTPANITESFTVASILVYDDDTTRAWMLNQVYVAGSRGTQLYTAEYYWITQVVGVSTEDIDEVRGVLHCIALSPS